MRPNQLSIGESVTALLTRTFDAVRVNRVINAPEVRPFVGGEGELDISAAIACPEHYFMMGEHGGLVATFSAPRVYEIHTFVLKGGRGEWARAAAAEMIAFMASKAERLWTKIKPEQTNVVAFATEMGMRPLGFSIETFGKPYDLYEMALPCR